jgi:D-threo-aldose 1-dehydrogenase
MLADGNISRRSLGRSGLEVTQAGLGAASLGNFYRIVSNAESDALLETAWQRGVRYFDTAPFYGRGRAERRLGRFLETKPRDSFVLSTKVGRLLVPAPQGAEEDGIFLNPPPFNSRYDYTYEGVMRSFEMSLQRLGLARIDILLAHDIGMMLHADDAARQLRLFKEGGLRALEELRARGDIRAYGLGVNEVEACFDCLDYGNPDLFLLAGRLTLLEQGAQPLLERCRQRGVGIVAGGIFNSGILATGPVPGAHHDYGPASADVLRKVADIELVCSRHGVALATAALQFVLSHPAVATVLLGVGTLGSLNRCLDAVRAKVPASLWDELVAQGLLAPQFRPATASDA